MSATFAEWLEAVFDHAVGEPGWYWADDFGELWDSLSLSDALTVAYLTRLFRTPSSLAPYSLDQVGQAIWFLVGEASPAQPSRLLVKSDVPFEARAAGVRAMTDFFRDFVAPAAPGPADIDEDAFHIACYMWWDIFPSWGGPQAGEPALHEVCLTVMGEILQLRSELCRLSALHGLNHWHFHHPSAVEGIIDQFLERTTDLTPRIREYAPMARKGLAQ